MWKRRGEDGGKEEGEDENGEHCTALLAPEVMYIVPKVLSILVPGVIYLVFQGLRTTTHAQNGDPRRPWGETALAVQIRQALFSMIPTSGTKAGF